MLRPQHAPLHRTTALIAILFATSHAFAANWCSADVSTEKASQALRSYANRRNAGPPRAIARLHTEGTLPHQGIWDQSIEAKKDLPLMRELALLWRASHDPVILDKLSVLLDAWAQRYQPSFNPIDETDFDALIDAFAITQVDLPGDTRERTATLVRSFASGYLDQMQHKAKPGVGTWTNNWQSHRIKLATMAAVALDDAQLMDAARVQFRKQLSQNLRADGSTIDFEERDALHYTVYDLEPLVRAAMAAHLRGEDWMHLRGENGATLALALDWLVPYAQRVKSHDEYVHTTVAFDRTRRAAGLAGFSGLWDAKSSAQLYWLSSTLDGQYQSVAQELAGVMPWIAACWQIPP